MTNRPTKRVIVGITGASGSIYAKELLAVLCAKDIEVHIVITDNGKAVFKYELELDFDEWLSAFDGVVVHDNTNMFSSIASGSFRTEGMIILPCSMATMAKIAHGIGDTLLCRAADVVLKQRKKLVVCPRETPLSTIHIKNMLAVSESSGIIFPTVPAFYAKPNSLEDMVNIAVSRILDILEIETENYFEWR